ncbi:hypothetical protein [Micromonospora sp. NPDC005171]|uniref:hypothetical protein n=1 Tax=Micromonospora sp. NPDC005171 TaxID=3156866 RepID=UPI0033BC52A5
MASRRTHRMVVSAVAGGLFALGVVAPGPAAAPLPRAAQAYVDQRDSTRWWQVLQFGLQNLFDPELDEWFTMDTFDHRPGEVTLPDRCPPPTS